VPQQSIPRLLRKRLAAKKTADRHALWTAARGWITDAELEAAANDVAAGVRALDIPGRVAVVEPDPGEALTLLYGAWTVGREVLLTAPDASATDVRAQVEEAEATLVLTAGDAGAAAEGPGVRVVRKEELEGSDHEPGKPARATDPALLVPSPAGVVVYSHFALASMASGLAAFIKELRDLSYLCVTPLCTWEALAGAIGALIRGGSVVFASPADLASQDVPAPEEGLFSILGRADTDTLMRAGRPPAVLQAVRYAFVSTGAFKARWRRRFESFLGRPILPIWGLPEIGPAVVSHPTWYPLESHGFPLVNVSIVPIDPDTGQQSVVPWEMLTFAEIGVESLSASLGYAQADKGRDDRIGKVVRTRQVANIDHVGVVTLHGPGSR
jgi:acyl-CoA synthetase (AMP-forming)/AMP-acid ligase II